MLCMFAAILSSVLKSRGARIVSRIVFTAVAAMSAVLLVSLKKSGESFVFWMGHFPAPWGNEIRAGQLEALMALFISLIALVAICGGLGAILDDVEKEKQNLYFILVDLMVSSLLAMVYTNDLFTAYVFIEINTIAGCGLIMVRQIGKSIVTAVRYMVISLLGSGLFLMGVTMLYTITGHLLMSNIKETVEVLASGDEYRLTLTVIVGLMSIGLAIKSGLFPFHLWIPDAYGYSNVCSSSLLSSIVSKGYIFLLIKIYYRVIGIDFIRASGIGDIIFNFGIAAMIVGSVLAIREKNFRRMIAYSSVAQIGYIFMGMGLGTEAGMIAAVFHILAHGFTKSLLFLSSAEFTDGSHSKKLGELYGLGNVHRLSALCYAVGAFSMTGFPVLAGFISKLLFATSAVGEGSRMYVTLIALAISTLLNAMYFLRSVTILYSQKKRSQVDSESYLTSINACSWMRIEYYMALIILVIVNVLLGFGSQVVIDIITKGLEVFA